MPSRKGKADLWTSLNQRFAKFQGLEGQFGSLKKTNQGRGRGHTHRKVQIVKFTTFLFSLE